MCRVSCAVRPFKYYSYFCALNKIMGRIIGIDYGLKRIGLAVTDPLQIFASPLITVHPEEFDNFITGYLKRELKQMLTYGQIRYLLYIRKLVPVI